MALLSLASVDAAAGWLASHGARALTTDSRKVLPGDAFIAWPGHAHDARAYVGNALAAGAAACLVEADGAGRFGFEAEGRVAAVAGLKAATGPIASRFMATPSAQLHVVACTGTNGKTSTTWWIAQALTLLGMRCGVVGTLGIGEPPRVGEVAGTLDFNGLTTPDPVTLHTAFRRFVDVGFKAAAIEASSIGIDEERLTGTHIETAVLTNFSQDHLDYHGDMATYWNAKARVFAWPGLRAAVINTDDVEGLALADRLGAGALDLWTCAQGRAARLRAADVRYVDGGLVFAICEGGDRVEVRTRLIGHYNVSNVLGVVAVLRTCGFSLVDAAAACAALTPVPGRMQRIGGDMAGPQVVVDYAHTPDALDNALAALRPFAAERGGKLWCVFGCGGNRDAAKRPLMGAIACRLADHVVVTSDNPRFEAPDFIISQVLAGVIGHDEVDVIESRADAVRHAVSGADDRDVVLLAGKGHEDYQEIGGLKLRFSDADHALATLRARGNADTRDGSVAASTGADPAASPIGDDRKAATP